MVVGKKQASDSTSKQQCQGLVSGRGKGGINYPLESSLPPY